jgi:hypothetical protein
VAVALLVRCAVAERVVRGAASGGAAGAAVSDGAAGAAVSDGAAGAVSVTIWAGGTVAPLAEAADVARRLVVGFTSCSEFS